MSNIIRLPKSEIYEDDLHNKPFLYWLQDQVDRISKFADTIVELKEESTRQAISPARVNECAAKFVDFYTRNIAFKKIYEEMRDDYEKQSDLLYNEMYLDTKKQVTDPTTDMGKRYSKKAATEKEIKIEMTLHDKYTEYLEVIDRVKEYDKKAETQDEFIKGLGRQDQVLNILQRASQIELKYLYLET